MKRALLVGLVGVMGWNVAIAQTACPITTPTLIWSDTTSSSLGFTTFSSEVLIEGILVVDVDFTFDNAEVGFKLGSIVVASGAVLTIENSSILTNIGTSLWPGITVEAGGRVEVYDSEICGAVTAIACLSTLTVAAEFDVQDSGLRLNETGIFLSNYSSGPFPGTLERTHIEGGPLA